MTMSNVDGTLVQVMNEKMHDLPTKSAPEPVAESVEQVENDVSQPEVAVEAEKTPESVPNETKEVEKPQEIAQSTEQKADSPIDEYGNPVEKPKMYSEDEVNRMIRDRLSRGRHAEQPTPHEVQKTADEFKHDPNSEETWEVQLEQFVERTIEKKQAKQAEIQWRQQEQRKQAEFEAKFTAGMSKYQDFHAVVADKPITNDILLAARNLENPAAFIYGAAKMHPQELERIARLPDATAKALEVGRLHERMVKERRLVSSAAKPIEAPRGDVTQKGTHQPSIEQRIHEYGKQRRK
jgi:hypothetical protein